MTDESFTIFVHCLLRVIPPLDAVHLMNNLGLSSHMWENKKTETE